MGQYLAIGFGIEAQVRKDEAEKCGFNFELLQERMKEELYFNPEIYNLIENETHYCFKLKDEVLHQELVPFLEKIYPLLYADPNYYANVIKLLQTTPKSEWLKQLGEADEYAFRVREDGFEDYITVGVSSVGVYYDSICLSIEGKVIMEEFERHCSFFNYTMTQAFKQFSLAGGLRVYITG